MSPNFALLRILSAKVAAGLVPVGDVAEIAAPVASARAVRRGADNVGVARRSIVFATPQTNVFFGRNFALQVAQVYERLPTTLRPSRRDLQRSSTLVPPIRSRVVRAALLNEQGIASGARGRPSARFDHGMDIFDRPVSALSQR